jgi:hypothetical protein
VYSLLFRGSTFSWYLYISKVCVKHCGRGKEAALYFTPVCFSPFGIIQNSTFKCRNWVLIKPVLGVVRDVALLQYQSSIDSIKPCLQCLCNFAVITASEGLLCFQICCWSRKLVCDLHIFNQCINTTIYNLIYLYKFYKIYFCKTFIENIDISVDKSLINDVAKSRTRNKK